MKQLFLLFVISFSVHSLFSQVPESINYQAVARDGDGQILANQQLIVQFTIHQGSIAGPIAYQESHSTPTNDFGLFSLGIGEGGSSQGQFNAIEWGSDSYYLKVEIEVNGQMVNLGSTQLVSVPYALYAKSAGNGSRWEENGNDLYFASGRIGIGTNVPDAHLHVDGNAPILFGGNLSGEGTKWFFHPDKKAVRSGALSSSCANCWDADSLGAYSFAHGDNVRAIGSSSVAFGSDTRSGSFASFASGKDVRVQGEFSTGFGGTNLLNGNNAFVSGLFNTVEGDNSVAIGSMDTASGRSAFATGILSVALGDGAIGMGEEAKARGTGAIALGNEPIAEGGSAIAIGFDATAYGSGSVAIGSRARTYAENSVAIGFNPRTYAPGAFAGGTASIASGYSSFAFGEFDSATSDYAVAFGQFSKAFGKGAIAMGRLARAEGAGSVAMGNGSEALGGESVAFSGSVASGAQAFAMGFNTSASGYASVTFGASSEANADGSMAIGYGTRTNRIGSLALGEFNVGSAGNMLEIGRGGGNTNRVTVFSVNEDGHIGINDNNPNYEIDIDGALATISINGLEIRNNGSSNLGLDGDVVPYNSPSFDIGNQTAGEFWDEVVCDVLVEMSDARMKENIEKAEYGLEEVMQLKPVNYRYRADYSHSSRQKIGFLAQDVEQIIPEAVISEDTDYDEESGQYVTRPTDLKGISYTQLIPVLINGMKEQQAIIEEQNERIEKLEQQVKGME